MVDVAESRSVQEIWSLVEEGKLCEAVDVYRRPYYSPPCRFGCKSPAIGIYYVPEGCICWPDPVQALCAQHFLTAESEGDIRCIVKFGELK